jgi:hypothetical protein
MNSKLLDKELSLLSVSGRWSVETISQEEVVIVLNLWMRKILVIAGCAALLATMGMYTETGVQSKRTDNRFEMPRYALNAQAIPHAPYVLLAPAMQPPLQSPDSSIQASTAIPRPEQIVNERHNQAAITMLAQTQNVGAPKASARPALVPAPAPTLESIPESTSAPTSETAPAVHAYEVTAYYLNVREQPSSGSAILSVVEKGDRLDVQHTADNGWYKLRDGGYVHGDYLKPVEGIHTLNAASPAVVTAVSKPSREVEIASAAPVPVPAVRKRIPGEPLKPTTAVKEESGLTEANIAEIFEGTALEGHDLEQAILDVEETYGINAYFTIAVMKLESGNGKSKLAKEKNNLFGLNAVGNSTKKAYAFESKADSVYKFGELISKKYVGKGYTTIEKVARKYCPANPKWASLVKRIMNGDYKKL